MCAAPGRALAACAWLGCVLIGCAAGVRPSAVRLSESTAASTDELAAAVAADTKAADRTSDSKQRDSFAADALRDAETCLASEPHSAACLYGHALALGLEARQHPLQATTLLKAMLDDLRSAEAVDPAYDHAGPARVSALVLIRAPGWPLGPGDTEAGVTAARRAVMVQPQYPPNMLALAEALAKSGDGPAAMESYRTALALAEARPESADRDDWLHEAGEGLRRP